MSPSISFSSFRVFSVFNALVIYVIVRIEYGRKASFQENGVFGWWVVVGETYFSSYILIKRRKNGNN
jgi:hypothetical protein